MNEALPSVKEVILNRLAGQTDAYKVGLVVEGGGMAGMIAAGEMQYYVKLASGKYPVDDAYGISSGAHSLVYGLTQNAEKGASVYYENLISQFIGFRRHALAEIYSFIPTQIRDTLQRYRLLRGHGPLIDLDYLTHVVKNLKPLDAQAVINCPTRIHIFATDVETGQLDDLYPYQIDEDVFNSLRATTNIPHIAGKAYAHQRSVASKRSLHIDGGIKHGGIALLPAVADNCSHILVMLSRGIDSRLKISGRSLVDRYVASRLDPRTAATFWEGRDWEKTVLKTLAGAKEGEFIYPRIDVIEVDDQSLVPGLLETNPKKLLIGKEAGYQAAKKYFETNS